MADALKQLNEALKLRRQAQRQIEKLDSLLADGTITQGFYDSTVSDHRSRLKAVNQALAAIRHSVRSKLSDAREKEAIAEQKFASFRAKHEGATDEDGKLFRDESKLRTKLDNARSRRAELERALAAESPADLRPPGEAAPEEDDMPPPHGIAAEFPGVSVPERLFMLFRETRNPEAKKPITVSGIVLAVITAVVIGAVAISGALADDVDTPDVIGRGEILVPVQGDNLGGIGRVSVTLEYDEDILTAVEIVPGVLARARTLTSDLALDGVVSVDIVSTYGFDPSGDLMLIVFRVNDIVADRTYIRVAGACAFALDGGSELEIETEDGWVDTTAFDVYAPAIRVS